MKKFSKTEDQALDKLLRSSAPRRSDPTCDGFDADLAAAYAERSLNQAEITRYENHLAACIACRHVTTSLMRAIAADSPNAAKSVEKASPGWTESLRGFFIAVSRPQAALAAAIVIALAATITFVVSKQNRSASSDQASAKYSESQTPNARPEAQQSPVAPAVDQYAQRAASSRANAKTESADKEMDRLVAEAQPRKEEADGPTPAPPATTEPSKPAGESDLTKSEETGRKAEPEQPKAAAPQPAPEEKPLPRIDGKRSLPTDDTASKAETIKPGRADVEAREGDKDKTATIRPDDSVTRRAEGSSSEKERRRIAAPPASARLREGSDEEKLNKKKGTPERQVAGKKFYLINEVWTDKDYKPEKEIPSVTVIRDSDLYKKLIAQHAKLKIYFERFAEESAIIVYNNTVYKLSPPEK